MLIQDQIQKLERIASALVAPGKGILAADESFPTIEKRFKTIDLPSTEENRRAYRELLFTTPGVEGFISGVIMFDESIRQKTSAGVLFPQVLNERGIIPGIKVDEGTESLPGSPEEKITKGLDGLPQRLAEYAKLGAQFAKWRAVITIGLSLPTKECIRENSSRLAEYAKLCQDAGLVPIVEPEVLMDGGHSLERCAEVTTETLEQVFAALKSLLVDLPGMLLKPNMVIAGKNSLVQPTAAQIAVATLKVFKQVVPEQVPGIVFLSGGQTPEQATENLNELNKQAAGAPWQLSFSYGRALQDPVLKLWKGQNVNVAAAQAVYYHRAQMNSLARSGSYSLEMEKRGI